MKKILIDVDEVICDSGFLGMINEFTKKNYTLDDFSSYYMENDVIDEKDMQEYYHYIKEKNFYKYAKIIDGAYDALKKISEHYEIYICSACVIDFEPFKAYSGLYIKNKYDFLIKNFPFLDVNKFIFTNSKNLFKTDIQIDDKLSNMQSDVDLKILFRAYHNKDLKQEDIADKRVEIVENWDDVLKLLF